MNFIRAILFTAMGAFAACTFNVSSATNAPTATFSGTFDQVSIAPANSTYDVSVHGNADPSIHATAQIYGLVRPGDESALAAETQITFVQNGTTVSPTITSSAAPSEESTEMTSLTLQVPSTVDVAFAGSSSNFTADGLSGTVNVQIDSGDVDVTTSGAITIMAASGDVRASAGGLIDVRADSGDVTLTGAGGNVQTASGDTDVNWTATTLQSLTVITASGDSAVHVPAQTGFHLVVDASSGGIDVSDLGVDAHGGSHFEGDVAGGGTAILTVHAASGSVTVTTAPRG